MRLDLTVRLVDLALLPRRARRGRPLLGELADVGRRRAGPRRRGLLPLLARPYAEPPRRPRRRPRRGRARAPRRGGRRRGHGPRPLRPRPRGLVVRAVRRGPGTRPRGGRRARARRRPLVARPLPLLRGPQPPVPGARSATPSTRPRPRFDRRAGRRSPPPGASPPGALACTSRRAATPRPRSRIASAPSPCPPTPPTPPGPRACSRSRSRRAACTRRAVELLEGCLDAIRRTRHRRVECWFGGWLAEAHLLSGDPRRAGAPARRPCAMPSACGCRGPPPGPCASSAPRRSPRADAGRARPALLGAHRLQRGMEAPLEAGLSALEIADCRLLSGDRQGGRQVGLRGARRARRALRRSPPRARAGAADLGLPRGRAGAGGGREAARGHDRPPGAGRLARPGLAHRAAPEPGEHELGGGGGFVWVDVELPAARRSPPSPPPGSCPRGVAADPKRREASGRRTAPITCRSA